MLHRNANGHAQATHRKYEPQLDPETKPLTEEERKEAEEATREHPDDHHSEK